MSCASHLCRGASRGRGKGGAGRGRRSCATSATFPKLAVQPRLCPYLHILQKRKTEAWRGEPACLCQEVRHCLWLGMVLSLWLMKPYQRQEGPFPFVLIEPVLCFSPEHPHPVSPLLGSLWWAPRELHVLFGLSIWPRPTYLFTALFSFLGTHRSHQGEGWGDWFWSAPPHLCPEVASQ